jgi:GDSL-like Lipase/Acylhydrolase family
VATMRTLVAFGDSIANGIGARGEPYPLLVAERLGARYLDLTGSAAQIPYALAHRHIAEGADIALIAFGITEGIIRPPSCALRFMPKRWRRPGWMDPRPYYSSRRWKRVLQRVESAIRWRVKVALIRLTRGIRWGDPETYKHHLMELIDHLRAAGTTTIVIVGHCGHDERFFPGSGRSCEEFLEINREVAQATGSLFCDSAGLCSRWDDFLCDHFHLSASGHRRIAEHLIARLSETSLAKVNIPRCSHF